MVAQLVDIKEGVFVLAALVSILAAAVCFYKYGRKRGYQQAKSELREQILEKRHALLYAPMYALFTTRHISSCQATLAPYFRMRFRNFIEQIKRRRIRYAFVVLFDKKKTKEMAEVEFGGTFPLDKIKQIIQSNVAYADEELLNLFRWADRSRYENPSEDHYLLTDEEFALFLHIADTYSKLNRIFS